MREHHGITVYDDHEHGSGTPAPLFQETTEVEYSMSYHENDGYESDSIDSDIINSRV